MIIHRKKFDIRQWVLVTDWNPLTVYMYNECYIRFAVMDYDIHNKSKFAHLTNNCVAQQYENSPVKKSKKERDPSGEAFEEGDEDGDEDPENIWSLDDFRDHMNKEYLSNHPDHQDIFYDMIQPQIKA